MPSVRPRPSLYRRRSQWEWDEGGGGGGGARVIGNLLNRQISYSYRLLGRARARAAERFHYNWIGVGPDRARPTSREGGTPCGAETARDKWEFQSRLRRNRISRVPFLAPSLPAFLTNFFFFLRPRAFLIGAFDRRTDGRREEGAPAHLPFSSFANRY